MIDVGPFQLQHPLARGGMGEVWRGVHRGSGQPVAVKVITAEGATRDRYLQAFANEVRAIAAMSHPGVALVYDLGRLGADAEEASEGRLVADSPWLAMEFASGGSLEEHPAPSSWGAVRSLLLTVLDALAHTHARGVVHRDLKPANVLVCTAADPRPGLKLADFGLAHASDTDGDILGVAGTPQYMAPEQISGDLALQGPWTDLYALGCLAWQLLTGATPFAALSGRRLLVAHHFDERPAFEPVMPVPDDVQPWLQAMLQRDPARRLRRAADAAAMLLGLGEPVGEGVGDRQAVGGSEATFSLSTLSLEPVRSSGVARADPGDAVPVAVVPPMPSSWEREEPEPPLPLLRGAGLGLFGVRSVPFVGRRRERDALWAELVGVHQTGRTAAVLLTGPSGVGTSRTARWLACRAHEVGAAEVVRVQHDEEGGGGVGDAVARVLGVSHVTSVAQGVTGVRERLAGWGSTRADDEEAWLALARPDLRGEVQLTTDDERFVALERLLAHLGRRRPVMVWVDDAHASLQTLQLVRRSLQADPARLLWVLTLRDDAVASSPRAEEALAELRAAGAAEVSLQPLDAAERWALVDQGLGLAPRAAHRIDERSGGHPGFVVQAVRDLVLRGQLVGSSAGLDLAEGAMLELPADARALWVRRLHGVMQGLPDEAHDALRVAAVLGRQVVGRHWDQVSDASGVLRRALVDRLLAARLAHVTPDGWRFAHEWLRRAVLEAATADACRADHARCARLLAGELSAEELGLHWLAAGDRSMALPLLVRAVDHRRRKRGPGPAVALARQVEESMAARLEASDPWWGAVWALHARALAEGGGDGAAVSEVLDRIDANGARVGWERARGWALLLRCKRGLIVEHAVDDDALEQARALGVSAGDGELVVSCDEASAIRAYRKGDVAGARAGFARAVQGARGTERAEILAPILLNCSVLEARGGRLAEAQLACDEALEAARRAGLREMVARAHLLLGEIWRERGDERAVAHYERAMALYRSMASDQHVPCRVGLARLEGHHGRWRRAAHHAVQALHHLGNDGHAPLRLACHVVRLAAAVRGGDAAAAQVHASRIRPLLGAPGAVDAESLQTVEALGSFDAAWARLAAEMRTFHEGNAVRT